MELSFVVDAVRRYWWMIALMAVLGAVPGFLATRGAPIEFESRAILLVVPARDARVQINVTAENERYVLGQLSVLQSGALAERVASELDDGSTAGDLLAMLSLHHIPRTDIVEVAIRTPSPERSQEVANAYAEAYLTVLRSQVVTTPAPEATQLDEQLDALREQLAEVDEAIAEALAPFLEAADAGSANQIQIPTADQVAPSLASERQLLLTEFNQLLSARNEINIGSPLRVATEIVEPATSSIVAVSGPGGKLTLAAGLLVGGFLGLVAAVLAARLSPRVLSARQAGELLGLPVLGAAAWPRSLADGPNGIVGAVTRDQRELVEAIRVRAETTQRPGEGLLIVVASAERADDVGPLAAALATALAGDGLATLLIDASRHDLGASSRHEQQPGLYDLIEALRAHPQEVPALADISNRTRIDRLVAVGPGRGRGQLRRIDVERLAEYAAMTADATVVDVGCLMDSAAGLQLATLADTVVLVVSRRAATAAIDSARRYLAPAEALVLPVWSDRRRLGSAPSRRSSGFDRAALEDAVDEVDADSVDDDRGAADGADRDVVPHRR